jgi:uncharacterized protein
MAQRAGEIELHVVAVEKPEGLNVIVGQAHFIKTVEDLHEARVGAVPELRFGVAFLRVLGAATPAPVRERRRAARARHPHALAIGAGTRSWRSFMTAFRSTS